ncbi:MAG: FAD-binding protein [Candidatus Lokiarchaeota archaeon]|nr:FAD-binding protein [Candidatus Lokiarchaeota archaeon]
MMSSKRAEYDIIIGGAGPAGLSSAIFCGNRDKKVLVLEKKKDIGSEPRGETLHYHEILDELLGKGFMKKITLSKTADRTYYAPDTNETIHKTRKTPSLIFDWKDLMQRLYNRAKEMNIEIKRDAEITELILDGDTICGAVYKDSQGNKSKAFAKCVLACDGFNSIIGRKLKLDYKDKMFPIIKCILNHGNFENKSFKYFFIPHGSLDYAPDFPPTIAFIFPRDKDNFEAGIMIQKDIANMLDLPHLKEADITKVWVRLKDEYPVFSEMLKGSSISYEKLTGIPMTGPIESFVPHKGTVLIGDAAAFVEASGGSGLVSSMIMAKEWVNLICDALENTKRDIWSNQNIKDMEHKFKKTKIYKKIKRKAKIYNWFRELLFKKWHTKEEIMNKWFWVKLIMKFA